MLATMLEAVRESLAEVVVIGCESCDWNCRQSPCRCAKSFPGGQLFGLSTGDERSPDVGSHGTQTRSVRSFTNRACRPKGSEPPAGAGRVPRTVLFDPHLPAEACEPGGQVGWLPEDMGHPPTPSGQANGNPSMRTTRAWGSMPNGAHHAQAALISRQCFAAPRSPSRPRTRQPPSPALESPAVAPHRHRQVQTGLLTILASPEG
jgi:hypothetical protein